MAEAAARAPGAERSTSGEELTPADVSVALLDGVERGDDLVLVGRTARLSWWVGRHAPGLYTRMMLRRLRPAAGDPRPTGPADPRDPARPGGAA
ncbi:MAG TPA: hypothetical protein VF140_06030 [Phycicoccus sp.]